MHLAGRRLRPDRPNRAADRTADGDGRSQYLHRSRPARCRLPVRHRHRGAVRRLDARLLRIRSGPTGRTRRLHPGRGRLRPDRPDRYPDAAALHPPRLPLQRRRPRRLRRRPRLLPEQSGTGRWSGSLLTGARLQPAGMHGRRVFVQQRRPRRLRRRPDLLRRRFLPSRRSRPLRNRSGLPRAPLSSDDQPVPLRLLRRRLLRRVLFRPLPGGRPLRPSGLHGRRLRMQRRRPRRLQRRVDLLPTRPEPARWRRELHKRRLRRELHRPRLRLQQRRPRCLRRRPRLLRRRSVAAGRPRPLRPRSGLHRPSLPGHHQPVPLKLRRGYLLRGLLLRLLSKRRALRHTRLHR